MAFSPYLCCKQKETRPPVFLLSFWASKIGPPVPGIENSVPGIENSVPGTKNLLPMTGASVPVANVLLPVSEKSVPGPGVAES